MIEVITTGGTIDKIYFDANSEFQVGDPVIRDVLNGANITVDVKITEVLRKDSLEITDEDRLLIKGCVEDSISKQIVITHGTDAMVDTGRALGDVLGKTIVLTGAMQPGRFKTTDATFNIAAAIMAVQILPPGVYIAMNGRIFDPQTTSKNLSAKKFE